MPDNKPRMSDKALVALFWMSIFGMLFWFALVYGGVWIWEWVDTWYVAT